MLEVQKYLQQNSLQKLQEELFIQVNEKDDLVILNYHQLESPKTHPIVRECRALVLEKGTWNLVAKSFNRFFNWGEMQEEMKDFNWGNCFSNTKEDGSLVILFNYKNQWYANTRGSWGTDICQGTPYTWREVILQALNLKSLDDIPLPKHLTYACELTSPYNKVVRAYTKASLWLLSVFEGNDELEPKECDSLALQGNLRRPETFVFRSIEQVEKYIREVSENDKTYEGIVVKDSRSRWKIKSATYLALHKLKGNGNIFNPKVLVSLVLSGDASEVLTYYPECEEIYREVEKKVNAAWKELAELWEETWRIESQKDFALAIVKKTPFSGTLFQLRKNKGKNQSLSDLKEMWRTSEASIVKAFYA